MNLSPGLGKWHFRALRKLEDEVTKLLSVIPKESWPGKDIP
jgi:hypothetical protein